MKKEGHLGRCYLKGHAGDAANAIFTAAAYNFRRILAWLELAKTLPRRRFLSPPELLVQASDSTGLVLSFNSRAPTMSPQVTTAIDADVQVQNGFGAMVHSEVICKYNLRAQGH